QPFINGLDLSENFYRDVVQPLLDKHFPDLQYSAALLGNGSEILGFDTAQSMDHDWGPRLMLFLSQADHDRLKSPIDQMLRTQLPSEYAGISTNFIIHESGSSVLDPSAGKEINHKVSILTTEAFCEHFLRFDPFGKIKAADWVRIPANHLLMMTAGRVFYDGLSIDGLSIDGLGKKGLGEKGLGKKGLGKQGLGKKRLGKLGHMRQAVAYYPHDVWLYLLSAQWSRIGQEEHFVGRCGQVGDELGSRLVAARLVSDLMRLCFLMERKYPPYIKWYGSAFARLNCAQTMLPILNQVLNGQSWQERQVHLSAAYETVAQLHNDLGITTQLEAKVSPFHDRPFLIIHAERFAEAIYNQIKDEAVLQLPRNLGSFDQFVDSTDAQQYLDRFESIFG
ncbi:MAG: hypothetical protein ACI85U_002630, partial [Candidatus Promineifilaceae bacterium]